MHKPTPESILMSC